MEGSTVLIAYHGFFAAESERQQIRVLSHGVGQLRFDARPLNFLGPQAVAWSLIDLHPRQLAELKKLGRKLSAMLLITAANAPAATILHMFKGKNRL